MFVYMYVTIATGRQHNCSKQINDNNILKELKKPYKVFTISCFSRVTGYVICLTSFPDDGYQHFARIIGRLLRNNLVCHPRRLYLLLVFAVELLQFFLSIIIVIITSHTPY